MRTHGQNKQPQNVKSGKILTGRNDLEKLENDKLLLRSHWGAVLNEHLFVEPSFAEEEEKLADEKTAIAADAFKLIRGGMSTALTTESTIGHLAKRMKARSRPDCGH